MSKWQPPHAAPLLLSPRPIKGCADAVTTSAGWNNSERRRREPHANFLTNPREFCEITIKIVPGWPGGALAHPPAQQQQQPPCHPLLQSKLVKWSVVSMLEVVVGGGLRRPLWTARWGGQRPATSREDGLDDLMSCIHKLRSLKCSSSVSILTSLLFTWQFLQQQQKLC